MNKVIIEGHLGANVELRKTNNTGRSVANFSVATNRTWYEKDGNGNFLVDQSGRRIKHEDTQWHKVVVWGPQAENCAKYLHSGSRVLVEGRIEYREFAGSGQYAVNKQPVVDGAGNAIQIRRFATEIVADGNGVTFLDKAPQNQAYNDQGHVVPPVAAPQPSVPASPGNVAATFTGNTVQPQFNPNTQQPQFYVPADSLLAGV